MTESGVAGDSRRRDQESHERDMLLRYVLRERKSGEMIWRRRVLLSGKNARYAVMSPGREWRVEGEERVRYAHHYVARAASASIRGVL